MVLRPGARIGRYEIVASVGAGGMGEVYRARDASLQRDVAIKVLPERVSDDPDRLARFEREARLLAALNHPSIAHVHGLEDIDGVRALVMEFVEGPTLAERIARGPVALDEALPIALQIAEALGAAHERGIVHRDLKPANIKLRSDGSVKVLDFGLAKAVDSTEHQQQSMSPTITSPAGLSAHGMILGTVAYMAPEQARGAAIDRRADIWAFGCVLFEMLTGDRLFAGDSVAETVAQVLRSDPEWLRLPAATPPSVRRLLRRCLERDPRNRLHDIADARLEIAEALANEPGDRETRDDARTRRPIAWAAVAAACTLSAVLGSIAASMMRRPAPLAREFRADIVTPATSDAATFALSPDGESLAYLDSAGGQRKLWLRSLASGATKELAGTDGAALPFWAPTGKSIGFFSDDGRLKRIDVDGGSVRALATAPLPWGASWSIDDTIVFAPVTGSIFRIPAGGGQPTPVTKLAARQSNHNFPVFLPDGRHFLYFVSGSPEVRGVWVTSLDGSDNRRLMDADGIAGVTSKYLLFMRETTLLGQRFDLERLQLVGSAFPIAESIALQPMAGSPLAAVSVSMNDRLAYRTGSGVQQRQFIWVDRAGTEIRRIGEPDNDNPLSPSLSPDGRYVAAHRTVGGNVDVWLIETSRGVRTRLTSHPGNDIHPLWAPDGLSILFSSNRTGAYQLYKVQIDGRTDEKPLLPYQSPATDWSPDGKTVLVQRRDATGTADIWAFPIDGRTPPYPVLASPEFDERDGQFSPDGKWVAFESTESGRWEVYVQPFPGPGAKEPVSSNGGAQPRWRPDGRELFFVGLDETLMAAPTGSAGAGLQAGAAVPLFKAHLGGAVQGTSRQQYFVSRDGERFLLNTVLERGLVSPITLLVNWDPAGNRRIE